MLNHAFLIVGLLTSSFTLTSGVVASVFSCIELSDKISCEKQFSRGCEWSGGICQSATTMNYIPPQNKARRQEVECPLVTLDFTSLPNPLADYYGQAPTFQGGDYLYDQLWQSHGVRVSARVLKSDHTDDSDPFIPRYVRGTGWVDDKRNQNPDDPMSGGAVRLFDTMRPTFSTNPAYHQPLCPDTKTDGDPDLGAPNGKCPGGGPGMSITSSSSIALRYLVLTFRVWDHRSRNRWRRVLW